MFKLDGISERDRVLDEETGCYISFDDAMEKMSQNPDLILYTGPDSHCAPVLKEKDGGVSRKLVAGTPEYDLAKQIIEKVNTAILPHEEEPVVCIKSDNGKLPISMVPPQIMRDISEVRKFAYDCKYGEGANKWKELEDAEKRYFDAFLRHVLLMMEDPFGKDNESGLPHYKHAACNLAFLCDIWKGRTDGEE